MSEADPTPEEFEATMKEARAILVEAAELCEPITVALRNGGIDPTGANCIALIMVAAGTAASGGAPLSAALNSAEAAVRYAYRLEQLQKEPA